MLQELMAEVERRCRERNHEVIAAVFSNPTSIGPVCAWAHWISRLHKHEKELVRLEKKLNEIRNRPHVWLEGFVGEEEIDELKLLIEDDKLQLMISEGCGECRACEGFKRSDEGLSYMVPRQPGSLLPKPKEIPDLEFIAEGGEGD